MNMVYGASGNAALQLAIFADRWQVTVERVVETTSSLLAFGAWRDLHVVLKVSRPGSDEVRVGSVAAAFRGHGMVRVYKYDAGVTLFEQLRPGTQLTELVLRGDDVAATHILAEVVATLHESSRPTAGFVTVETWGRGFDRYLSRGGGPIARKLVEEARECYAKLCSTQREIRLLHGDLQHYNVLADRARRWIAIDPKGVVGELEFELGAALRNPHGVPELYSSGSAVERRVSCFAEDLRIDPDRVLAWAHAQAVLSAIWTLEDEGAVSADDPALLLAATIENTKR